MITLNKVRRLLTFPGIIVHGIAHKFMCDILQVPVYRINYFSLGTNQTEHVHHHKIDNINQDFLIAMAPLLINTLVGILFTLPYMSTIIITHDGIPGYIQIFLYWIGMSAAIHAFPSNEDIHDTWAFTEENNSSGIIAYLCAIVHLGNYLGFLGHIIYASFLSIALPSLIFGGRSFC